MSTPYLHDLAPFLFRVDGEQGSVFMARWDVLAWLGGFGLAVLLLRRFSSRGYLPLARTEVFDFTSVVALLGVLLGGRLGYLVAYEWERFSGNLGLLFQFNLGGMSFLGGLVGVAGVTAFQARARRVSFLALGDNLATVAPLSLLLGRLASFMDGELFGRVTQVPWAMRFPAEIHLAAFEPAQATRLAVERLPASSFDIMQVAHSAPRVMDELLLILHPRHPSQLYEAALEGLLLFAVLSTVRTRARQPPEGLLCALFLVLYAVAHFVTGFWREPGSGDPMVLGLAQGQLFCLPVLTAGLGLLGGLLVRRPQAAAVPAPSVLE